MYLNDEYQIQELMENLKFTRRLTILLVSYSLINIFLIMIILVTRYDMNRKINNLERKIEVLEIHIFPDEYLKPKAETRL